MYLFDEFDAIGSQRGLANDVGEIRRVLNSFLAMIEQDNSHSLVLAATNHPGILDAALFRRFDDVLHYDLPDGAQIAKLFFVRLGRVAVKEVDWKKLARNALGLSYADVTQVCNETLKDALINKREKVNEAIVKKMIDERFNMTRNMETKEK